MVADSLRPRNRAAAATCGRGRCELPAILKVTPKIASDCFFFCGWQSEKPCDSCSRMVTSPLAAIRCDFCAAKSGARIGFINLFDDLQIGLFFLEDEVGRLLTFVFFQNNSPQEQVPNHVSIPAYLGIVQKVFSEKASATTRMRQKCVKMGLLL